MLVEIVHEKDDKQEEKGKQNEQNKRKWRIKNDLKRKMEFNYFR